MEQVIIEAIRTSALLISAGVASYAVLSGIAKIIKAVTLARKIEQTILNQIEDMAKAKLEKAQRAEKNVRSA